MTCCKDGTSKASTSNESTTNVSEDTKGRNHVKLTKEPRFQKPNHQFDQATKPLIDQSQGDQKPKLNSMMESGGRSSRFEVTIRNLEPLRAPRAYVHENI